MSYQFFLVLLRYLFAQFRYRALNLAFDGESARNFLYNMHRDLLNFGQFG